MKKIIQEVPNKDTLQFHAGTGENSHEVLRLYPSGKILWFVEGKEIEVVVNLLCGLP